MPSTSKKQHNLMAMVANNPAMAKKLGIKQSVGEEFMKADKGRKFGKGGETHEEKGEMKKDLAQDKKMIKKAFAMHDKQEHKGERTDLSKLKKGGMAMKIAKKPAMSAKRPGIGASTTPTMGNMGDAMMKKGGKVKKMAGGGLAAGHKSADGIATKGKTKARSIAMCGGGKMRKGGKVC